jgi:hypothetical protein
MTKQTILFLAANPAGTSQLRLAEECAAIQRELRLSITGREDFHFESRWAVSVDEMMRHLLELAPVVVHFSGHGVADGGIVLHGDSDDSHTVSGHALAAMIRTTTKSVRVVLLNACYSAEQAEALRDAVDCVVGLTGEVADSAAHAFAVGFYRALGYRRSVGGAIEHARATLGAKGLGEQSIVQCEAASFCDPSKLFLDPFVPRCAPTKAKRGEQVASFGNMPRLSQLPSAALQD